MDRFEIAVQIVLEHEGGFVDNKHDPGGATNYGISLRWLNSIDLEDADVDRDGDVDADDIKAMTERQAKYFYQKYWWNKYRYYLIEDLSVATKVFDMSVNMGAKQAHLLLQRSLRAQDRVLKEDGVLGPNTLLAVNGAHSRSLVVGLRCTQAGFYRALVMRNNALRKARVKKDGRNYEDFSVFLTGWLRRAYS